MAQKKRSITAEDLYQFQLVSAPQLSPDGQSVIFCVSRTEAKSHKKYTNLWLASTKGGAPRQFTYGDQNDTNPRWSPDGRSIAFLSNRGNETQNQIYLLPFHGGEARPLTDLKGSFGAFEWSPDGKQFVLMFRQKDAAALERESDEQKKKLGIVERHITRVDYKLDGAGYLPQERWHIWTVDARNGKAEQLTKGPTFDETNPRWSPDGKSILFISNRAERSDFDFHLTGLYIMPAKGGDFRQLPTPEGSKYAASWSPDGQWIAFLCRQGKGNIWQNTNLWLVPSDGGQPAQNITGHFDLQTIPDITVDCGEPGFVPPVWSPDGEKIYTSVTRHGEIWVSAFSRDGRQHQKLVEGGTASNYSFDKAHKQMAYLYADWSCPLELFVQDLATGKTRQLSSINQSWLKRVDLGEVEEVWFKGPDQNDLQGWIIKPPHFDENKKYPSILQIHGGPWLQYGKFFMHEFYYLAAKGYVVYLTNPRGGQGYGEAHGKALHNNWGTPDYGDMMAWVDLVAQKPYIDTNRMGITGGSYGGYLTLWITSHTNRFKTAVAQRVVSNTISFWGSSDVGYFFQDVWSPEGKAPWADLEPYWNVSPMKYVDQIKTPMLLIHSEQDMRCSPEQSEQVFVALRDLGVDSELVLYPDESHGLSRNGRTDRRISRLNHILRWFNKYLL